MTLKITGTTKNCRECPNRVYYSGGVYECTAAGDVQIKPSETDTIPDWCPLPDYPIVRRSDHVGSPKQQERT